MFVTLIALSGCELFVVGEDYHYVQKIEKSQKSPLGAIYLFKAEIDNKNVAGATDIFASPNGTKYLAIERYDMYFEIARLGRVIFDQEITYFHADTISGNSLVLDVEFNYLNYVTFTTSKIDSGWYIVSYKDSVTKFIY